MSRLTTAVLLSALIFPGAGHLYLKRYSRGAALIAVSVACLWVIVDRAMRQATLVLDKIESGEIVPEVGRISDLVAQTSNSPGSSLATVATLALAGCWLVGMVDAYRLGRS